MYLLAFVFIALAMFSAYIDDFHLFITTLLSLIGSLLGHSNYENIKQVQLNLLLLFLRLM